ncbi:MAG: thioesterase family protein [Ignavibacteria bacterium]|nr:MAG: acyl-CoA thioesterase [Chlorobiota bacterium]MBV6399506.1 putative esterase [Ignavibacteria bacterium]MCC6886650.1 acyl-CoA thioesterase [Ignavibacteriales bacterium]MCE7953211.1 acyl-CoA thioesterase [Chlorobi bacterium CHB7]RIK50079.1 MAG: acyl-CoA thioesterase [Ignavibacteriota bacterium]
MIETVTKIRVLYAHTDKMGVVNNSRYLEYFEAGRNELLREIGCPYTIFESNNVLLPVTEVYCKYIAGVRYDDVLEVRAMLKEVPGARIKVFYEVTTGGKIAATGYTVHSFVDSVKFKARRPPEDFVELIKSKLK